MIAAAASLLGLGLAGCTGSESNLPNIVLVTIDTLRADRLSAYGYPKKTSPFIDALAAEGVRFERAHSSSSWTAPSVVSLLTSLPANIHGVEHGYLEARKIVQQEVIPDAAPVLAELLQQRGYRTFGITANSHLQSALGFDRGFDRYSCLGFDTASAIEAHVRKWRDEIREAEPWFLWLHFFDPHAPYTFHKNITRAFLPPGIRRMRALERDLVPEHLKERGVELGNPRFQYVEGLYDGEVRFTDETLSRIFDLLEIGSDALVIVTADHGEELLDHGRLGHGNTLYEEVIRIPLIVRLPGGRHGGTTVGTPVSDIDVVPSILDVIGTAPPSSLAGHSLLPLLDEPAGTLREVTSSLARLKGLETTSLTVGDWKYIDRTAEPVFRGLFDLANDPHEQVNRLDTDPEMARLLSAKLREIEAAARKRRLTPGVRTLPGDEAEELKALGYFE